MEGAEVIHLAPTDPLLHGLGSIGGTGVLILLGKYALDLLARRNGRGNPTNSELRRVMMQIEEQVGKNNDSIAQLGERVSFLEGKAGLSGRS